MEIQNMLNDNQRIGRLILSVSLFLFMTPAFPR